MLCQEVEYLGCGVLYAVCIKLEIIALDLVGWAGWFGWRGGSGRGLRRRKGRWRWGGESSRWRLRVNAGGAPPGTIEGIVVSVIALYNRLYELALGRRCTRKMSPTMRHCARRHHKARALGLDIFPI